MKTIILIVVVLAVAALFFVSRSKTEPNTNTDVVQSLVENQKNFETQFETQTDDQPPVSISVTPIEFGIDVQSWKFKISFDTHSGSLDDNPLEVVSLVDDTGKIYKPSLWNGPVPGGHHIEGELVFDAINPIPKFVDLKIKNVGGISERSFRWELK